MMTRIFLSYKRSDRKRLNKLVALLHEHYGINAVWWDQHFVGGDLWWNEILKQIADCDVFIYLMTVDSLLSPYCQAELEEARRLHKRILPVKFKRGTKVPQMMADLHYVDLDGGINHKTIAPLLRSINEHTKQSQHHLPPLMNTPVSKPDVSPRERPNVIADYAREIIIGILVTIVGGIILAWLLQADRFAPLPDNGNDAAINRALNFTGSNDDWQPFEQEFDGVEMVLVPAGCFTMGSDDGASDEQPAHEVCFDEPFWIDRTEVTNEQYGSTGCEDWSSESEQPRNCVTWLDAQAHCEARSASLPAEAQWEYAARGVDNLIYPWGNTYVTENVIGGDDPQYGGRSTAPVGSRPDGVSWVGAYDMSGNLWEWTSSVYEDYPYDASDGREDSERTDVLRVLRGGSFYSTTYNLRSAFRSWGYPDTTSNSLFGFRCLRSYP